MARRKTRAQIAIEDKLRLIDEEVKLLEGMLNKYKTPLPLPEEPASWYERFLFFCRLGGPAKGLNKIHALYKRREARAEEDPNPKIAKEAPGNWKQARIDWHWDDRYTEWRQILLRLDWLEDSRYRVESNWVVAEQIKALDEQFNLAQKYLSEIQELPLESLRPKLSDVAALSGIMVSIVKNRQDSIKTNSDSEIERAIATLAEAGYLPDEIAARSSQNLADFYESQKQLFLPDEQED